MMYDVIIIGASYAGVICARRLAQEGHRVLLLDRLSEADLGQRHQHVVVEIDTYSRAGIPRGEGDEFVAHIEDYYLYTPSGQTRKGVPNYSSLVINGYLLLRRLLAETLARGVEFRQVEVKDIWLEAQCICGVYIQGHEGLKSRMVVDASGAEGVICQKLPASWGFGEKAKPTKTAVAFRQLRQTETPPSELHIYFPIPHGYIWRSAYDVGIGLLHTPDCQPEQQLEQFLAKQSWELGEIQSTARGMVPIQPPLPNLVADRFAVVGDAACMVNTLRGGGIATALQGGKMLGEVLHKALKEDKLSQNDLWEYNVCFHRQVGAQLAYQDTLRAGMLELELKDIEYAYVHDLITAEDLMHSLNAQLIKLSPLEKLQRGLRGVGHPALLMHLDDNLSRARKQYHHYLNYPESPEHFSIWLQEL